MVCVFRKASVCEINRGLPIDALAEAVAAVSEGRSTISLDGRRCGSTPRPSSFSESDLGGGSMESKKICSVCSQTKPIEHFSKHARMKDGLQRECKHCRSAMKKAARKDNPESFYLAGKRYRIKYRERISEYNSSYRKQHRAEASAVARAWERANPERVREIKHRRRSRKYANAVFRVTPKFLLKLYRSTCIHCGSSSEITADHVIPIAKGGTHGEGNLMPLCRSCNSSKSDRLYVEFRYMKQA